MTQCLELAVNHYRQRSDYHDLLISVRHQQPDRQGSGPLSYVSVLVYRLKVDITMESRCR